MTTRFTARRGPAMLMVAVLVVGVVLMATGVRFAIRAPEKVSAAAADPTGEGASPCPPPAAGLPHCDWFGENGMDLPAEVVVAPASAGPRAAACAADGASGMRVQAVLYVPERGYRQADVDRRLFQVRTALHGVDVTYQQSGLKTGEARPVRWVTGADCEPDIRIVTVPDAMLTGKAPSFEDAWTMVRDLLNKRRLVLGFWPEGPSWGIGELTGDDLPGAASQNASGNRFGIVYGNPSAFVAAHELGHLLGAVAYTAPNSSGYGHCTSLFDVMCYSDAAGVRMARDCSFTEFNRVDCGDDDYFASVPRGFYLPGHWNVADSPFLYRSGGPAACRDVSLEPDDWRGIYLNLVNPRKVFAAPVLARGGSQTRVFCGEYDWSERARFVARAGERYRVKVTGLDQATTTLIRVWDPASRRYVASNAGSDDPFTLTFGVKVRGPVGIEVINRHPGDGTGVPFTLEVVPVGDR